MIVCMCHAISDAHVRELAHGGASANDVMRLTRAGTSCGCCVSTVERLVAARKPPCGKAVPCAGCACVDERAPREDRHAA
jgi:bacterioferritin-associated ferredoxin